MSNDLSIDDPDAGPSSDSWSEWLLRRRHGGDPHHEPVVRGMVERMRDRVLDGAGLQAGVVLVDVGAGDGLIAFGAFDRVGPSMKALLVDVSAALLSRAEQHAVRCGLRERCTFIQTSAERLDGVADQSADVLTTRAVLAYVADKAAAAVQFNRVLKPGGRISIAEPIYRDEALHLAALNALLLSPQGESVAAEVRLMHRCRALQLPSTLDEIQDNPLTNFSERDLIAFFQRAGFHEIHLELHIDIRKQPAMPWDTFIDIAPRPGAATLREIFASHLTGQEQRQVEAGFRPLVEAGHHATRDTIAYLTASKREENSRTPAQQDLPCVPVHPEVS